jgi:integration host factor subunit alpha
LIIKHFISNRWLIKDLGDFIMALKKADLINSLYNNCGLTKALSIQIVENLLDLIKDTLVSGEDVMISRFGKFCANEKKERRGRNPQTGNDLILGNRRVVTYQCSGISRDKIIEKRGRTPNGISQTYRKRGIDKKKIDRQLWCVGR